MCLIKVVQTKNVLIKNRTNNFGVTAHHLYYITIDDLPQT